MRTAIVLLALAGAAAADELIAAKGDGLADFRVELRLDGVDHGSARALAASFARFVEQQSAVADRYRALFHAAHVAVLARTCDDALVAVQKRQSGAPPHTGFSARVRSVDVDGDTATAVLARAWTERGRAVTRRTRLRMARTGDRWRITELVRETSDGKFRAADIGFPPALPPLAVPDPAPVDRSSALACVESLKRDMIRLRAVAQRGKRELYRDFFAIAAAFYGRAAAEKARAARPEAAAPPARVFRVAAADGALAGLRRVTVTALERVPGTDEHSAIGQVAYDLRQQDDGRWTITAEMLRPKPDARLVKQRANFGLFFLG